ncbi:MAG: phosphatidylglycerol lysyltransferase domain-containing protein [Spirochaetaceae bacterium]|nr:phosphatidylglycerol lysyltransferase domain-containing protein [Spirochaetaceae bacterium]
MCTNAYDGANRGIIPAYPTFAPLDFTFQAALHERLYPLPDGVSEYTFANLYLFRNRYHYVLSLHKECLILSGERGDARFFMCPGDVPEKEALDELFRTHAYWKGISESVATANQECLAQWGIAVTEDRDNFDYLYLRTDLAELPGKKYHKKRNLVNAFLSAYPNHAHAPLTGELLPDAMTVLNRWREDKGEAGDYEAAKEALERFRDLGMQGRVFYIDGNPVGWCLGETVAQGTSFALHFEKALDKFKGIYQFMNQTFASSLPETLRYINREQDLGDEGLRQAKMTYRPWGFVRKYTGHYPSS